MNARAQESRRKIRLYEGTAVNVGRINCGLTVDKLADQLGMSSTSLGDRLHGRVPFSADQLKEAARRLCLPEVKLFAKRKAWLAQYPQYDFHHTPND